MVLDYKIEFSQVLRGDIIPRREREIVVGISGASGVCYGIKLLEVLSQCHCKTHLIMTDAARKIVEIETDEKPQNLERITDYVYSPRDFTAPIASGSHIFEAMIVAPCSMRTLAGIANGITDTLLSRAADVCLKERRRLVLVPRESPLNLIHLKNMVKVTEAGAIILPPCPGFYSRPQNLDDLVNVVVGRILDIIGVEHHLYDRWGTLQSGNTYNDENPSKER